MKEHWDSSPAPQGNHLWQGAPIQTPICPLTYIRIFGNFYHNQSIEKQQNQSYCHPLALGSDSEPNNRGSSRSPASRFPQTPVPRFSPHWITHRRRRLVSDTDPSPKGATGSKLHWHIPEQGHELHKEMNNWCSKQQEAERERIVLRCCNLKRLPWKH